LFEVIQAILKGNWQEVVEEIGDVAYYVGQSPVWWLLCLLPGKWLDQSASKMTKRASK